MYPTALEGFGNQFIESIFFEKPILLTPYEVYKKDIKPLGFSTIEIEEKISNTSLEKIKSLIGKPNKLEKITKNNFKSLEYVLLAGEKINRLSRKFARRGWLAVAVVRIIPIAPFTIVNLVAGSTHISTRSFLIGTAIGMGPGILAIMLFEGGLEHAIREPGWLSLTISIVVLACALLLLAFCKRWLLSREEKDEK